MAGKRIFNIPWVIDSGATEHVACNNQVLFDLRNSKDDVPLRIPNGDSVPVQGVGNANLPYNIKIDDVLYIPNFR